MYPLPSAVEPASKLDAIMSQPAPWSGPGTILSFFKLRDTAAISEKTLEEWFAQEYVPALVAARVIKSAWLYRAVNAKYDKQNLIVYKVRDLALVQAGKIQEVPRSSKTSLFGGCIDDYIEVDTRIYSFVQLYEMSKHGEDASRVVLLAMMEPGEGGQADMDAWYRNEHNEQMSKEPGWQRTTRFSLLHQHSSANQESEKLSFLAIHEFGEVNQLGTHVKVLEPMSDWTKKVMANASGIDAAIYHKQRGFGGGENGN